MLKIPIVLSTDDNYIPLVDVCLISLFENKNSDTYYDVFIFMPSNSSSSRQEKLLELKSRYDNVNINIIDMKDEFSYLQGKIKHKYVSLPTYYKLLPSKYLQYDKCIYLDCDTIICNDLTELYNIDLSENLISASPGIDALYLSEEQKSNAARAYQIPDFNHYFNSGIMSMNLIKIKQDNILNIWYEEAKKLYEDNEQGILNATCYGKFVRLPLKYNARLMSIDKNDPILINAFGQKEIDEAFSSPAILHFSSANKPWLGEYNGGADIFWKYARKSNFYEQIICWKNTKQIDDLKKEIKANNTVIYSLINFSQLKYKYYFYRFLQKALLFIKISKLNKKVEQLRAKYKEIKAIKKQFKEFELKEI